MWFVAVSHTAVAVVVAVVVVIVPPTSLVEASRKFQQ